MSTRIIDRENISIVRFDGGENVGPMVSISEGYPHKKVIELKLSQFETIVKLSAKFLKENPQ